VYIPVPRPPSKDAQRIQGHGRAFV